MESFAASAGIFRLSIWTSLYWDLSPEDALRHIADQGWEYVDLSCEHFGELWRADWKRVDDWRALANELGVTPWQCHLLMDLNLAASDITEQKLNVNRCAEYLRLASRLGIKNAVLHPGWLSKECPGPPSQVRGLMTSGLAMLVPVCAATNVRLAIENMVPPYFGVETSHLVALAEATAPEYIGICYDSSHAMVAQQSIPESLITCGRQLFCLHLSDSDGSADQHLLPYEGAVDWSGLVAGLQKIAFEGPLNFELPSLSCRPLPVRDAALPYIQRLMTFAATGGDCCYPRRTESISEFCHNGWFDPQWGYS
ncbi:MAG: sugar phosphate isomerase/epimerase family protein [Candidatus Zipacnadales bacterium]